MSKAVLLGAFVGSWTIHVTFWPAPGAAPQEGEGTAEIEWVLGGRYIEQRQNARLPGGPVSGIGYTGFDEVERRYVSLWLDDASTSVLLSRGAADPSGKILRTRGTIGPLRYEDAVTIVNPDKFIYEAWTSAPGKARMRRVMNIVYTRR